MGKRAAGADTGRVQLGPFWLWHRRDRDDWCICWYDDGGSGAERRTRRLSTGIGGGRDGRPPQAAEDALATHYLESQKPVEQPIDATYVENLMADWLLKHAIPNLSDPTRYSNGVKHWQTFFAEERRAGRLTGQPTVADINTALVSRFHTWRRAHGVSAATISRDTAALRQPLNWAWKTNLIPSAPFVPDVHGKPEPKDLVYTMEQVAAILEAALAVPEREHIHLFAITMLSTHARVEAVLGCDLDVQYQDGLIYWNAPGRAQTKKRRSIIKVGPTLAQWLEGRTGRLIQWKRGRFDASGKWVHELLPADSIKNAFERTLLAAGLRDHALDERGEPIWLPARRKLGETAPRPKLIGIGSPNTLRHTCSTELHRRGVPEAQIDTAAGHSGDSTNKRHYRHLRPEYLSDFIGAVEDYWGEMAKLTTAHLRYQRDTKIVDFGAARVKGSPKNG